MTVSVAMATYNGAKHLRAQLDSIQSQTRLPDELVICDDCSLDSTVDLVTEFAKTATFQVLIVRNDARLGSTKNFEKAISLCTGDVIALCDQDDIWLPEKLERQCAMLERDPGLGGVFSDARLIDSQSQDTGKTLWQVNRFTHAGQMKIHNGDMFSDAVTKWKALGCTMIFRASLVDKIIPIPERWDHDGWIAWIIAMYSRIDIIPEALICYRIHPTQSCGVAPLSLSDHLQDRTDMYAKKARLLSDLCDRIRAQHSPEAQCFLAKVEEMIEYLRFRSNLPENRMARVVQVMRNIANYRRFDSGWLSAFKDITR